MRVPSEPAALRWSDIDFERGRIDFRAPKTEHHEGKERREIPIFPELLQPLLDVAETADPGEELVLPFLQRVTETALRKPLKAAIKKAQATPWPKLWNALRATRTTELRERFPSHVVDAWLGHDDNIARKHYAQTLDDHFRRAAGDHASEWSGLQKCSHFASSRDSQAPHRNTKPKKTRHFLAPLRKQKQQGGR